MRHLEAVGHAELVRHPELVRHLELVRHPEAVHDLPIPRAHDDLLPDSFDLARLARAGELNGRCRYIENRESAALQRQLKGPGRLRNSRRLQGY